MAGNQDGNDDEDGFGDFTFVSSHIYGSFSAITPEKNKNNVEDDDDWGDFINYPGVISRTESLPTKPFLFPPPSDPFGFFIDRNGNDSTELTQPGSAPSQIDSKKMSPVGLFKPQGAIPLSIFGQQEDEEEEEKGRSGVVDASFNGVTDLFSTINKKNHSNNNNNDDELAKKGSNLIVAADFNDLIENLYKQSEPSKPENGLRRDSTDLNLKGSKSGKNGENLYLNGNNWDWNGLSLDRSVSDLGTAGGDMNSIPLNMDLNGLESSRDVTNSSSHGRSLSWNPLNLDAYGTDLNRNVSNSYSNDASLDSNGITSSVNQIEDEDEDGGWEFKAAQSKVSTGDELSENAEKKTENGLTLDSNVSNLNWNLSSSDLSKKNSHVIRVNTEAGWLNSDLASTNGAFDDGDGWEFKVAESETQEVDAKTKVEGNRLKNSEGAELFSGFGNGSKEPGDLFAASDVISHNSGGWAFGFDFNSNPTSQNSIASNSFSHSKQNETEIWLSSSPIRNVDSHENSFAFKVAFSENGLKDKEEQKAADMFSADVEAFACDEAQRNELRLEKHKGPLPLSIFGDGELEKADPIVQQDTLTSEPAIPPIDHIKNPASNISIHDLLSSLYSQAEEKTSVNHGNTEKPTNNGLGSAGFDSNLVNGNNDFDDDSWEFKGAFLGAGVESLPGIGHSHKKYDTKAELNDYVDFYSKLKDELCYIALNHLGNLKKARSIAAQSGEEAEVKVLDEEIQDLHNQLQQDSMIPGEVDLEHLSPRDILLDEFMQVLWEPKFQALESEYQLSKKLSLAEQDLRSTIELLKHVGLTLKILTGGSIEEQANYVSTWSRIISVCAQELKHGAFIWKQALEKNIYDQVLSKPQGKKYLLALAEIYRVVEILRSSIRLYKPWVLLSSADPMSMLALMNDCSTSWSSSGLKEALPNMAESASFEYDGSVNTLLESIKHVGDLDALSLYNHVFSGQEPTCRVSLLTAGTIPGMRMVIWNGEHYFVTLANLWANLISSDPPSLPPTHAG